ncbi:unnamed protein product [Heligmosomoides polygyrus]|uniref:Transposase n=1 Tax=Heligmosomoides polygyrus TaxID=6339 RepID=A0A183FDA6_HELPZ|nr:unnamed protein product [Heligmosomoides polygyrus]
MGNALRKTNDLLKTFAHTDAVRTTRTFAFVGRLLANKQQRRHRRDTGVLDHIRTSNRVERGGGRALNNGLNNGSTDR